MNIIHAVFAAFSSQRPRFGARVAHVRFHMDEGTDISPGTWNFGAHGHFANAFSSSVIRGWSVGPLDVAVQRDSEATLLQVNSFLAFRGFILGVFANPRGRPKNKNPSLRPFNA
jgi:hypothetical protein